MTAKRRRSLPRSVFGIPSKRKYPLDTPGRARNALSRISRFGTPAQKRAIQAKVKRKYPSIRVAGTTRRRRRR